MIALVVGSVALLASLGTALYVSRCRPIIVKEALDNLIDQVSAVQRDQARARLDQKQFEEGVTGILEEIEATEERTKRHRRKATQAAAKLGRSDGAGFDPSDDSPEALRARARALGIPV